MDELVNSVQHGGSHYGPGQPYQHWDWVVENNVGYLPAQVTKYLCRHRNKGGREDLAKALHYANKMVEVYRAGRLPYPAARRVKRLEEMVILYRLNTVETTCFLQAAVFTCEKDLLTLQELVRSFVEAQP